MLQVALDFLDLERAIQVAKEAVAGGVDWIEAGTPLIKSEGLNAVRELRRHFPNHVIVADMKTMDAGKGGSGGRRQGRCQHHRRAGGGFGRHPSRNAWKAATTTARKSWWTLSRSATP